MNHLGTQAAFALLLVAATFGCSSSDPASGTAVDIHHFCDALQQACPQDLDASDLIKCKTECETGQNFDKNCQFGACSLEVGKCDNGEDNDKSITDCAVRHGWRHE